MRLSRALRDACIAAILGDSVNYWIGYFLGEKLQQKYPRLIKPQYLERTHAFFERYGGKTINTLRLWSAATPDYFDFQQFSSGDFVGALACGDQEFACRIDLESARRLLGRGLAQLQLGRRDEALAQLRSWVEAGRLKVIEDIVEGFENLPDALIGLLHGDNRGKRMVNWCPASLTALSAIFSSVVRMSMRRKTSPSWMR